MVLQHGSTSVSYPASHDTVVKDETARTVANVVHAGGEAIETRLRQLDHEWTIGRVINITVGVSIIAGLALAVWVHLAWILLPVAVGLLVLQYAVSGTSLLRWLLHRVGLRSGMEISHERIALKALRGDFRHLPAVLDRTDEEAIARMAGEGGVIDPPEASHVTSEVAAHQVLDALKQ